MSDYIHQAVYDLKHKLTDKIPELKSTDIELIIKSWLNDFVCVHCPNNNHIPEPGKKVERKLKPVDKNCLYKDILYYGLAWPNPEVKAMYMGAHDKFYENDKWHAILIYKPIPELLWIDSTVIHKKITRIPDYDYGDGGNYVLFR